MMDLGPGEVTAAVAAWQAGKAVAPRLLGPTADYLGERILDSVKAAANLSRVFVKAYDKLGPSANEAGVVPPRVLKAILDEGPFCDDELCAEYLGGLLASSRTADGTDEESLALLATVSRLPITALVLHFAAYRALAESNWPDGREMYAIRIRDALPSERFKAWITEGTADVRGQESAMNYLNPEVPFNAAVTERVAAILLSRIRNAAANLRREHLVSDQSSVSDLMDYRKSVQGRPIGELRLVFSPTELGLLLYLRLHGHRDTFTSFMSTDLPSYDASLPQASLERLSEREVHAYATSLLD